MLLRNLNSQCESSVSDKSYCKKFLLTISVFDKIWWICPSIYSMFAALFIQRFTFGRSLFSHSQFLIDRWFIVCECVKIQPRLLGSYFIPRTCTLTLTLTRRIIKTGEICSNSSPMAGFFFHMRCPWNPPIYFRRSFHSSSILTYQSVLITRVCFAWSLRLVINLNDGFLTPFFLLLFLERVWKVTPKRTGRACLFFRWTRLI